MARPGRTGPQWIYGRHAVAAALANPARRCRRIVALTELEDEVRRLLDEAAADLPSTPPEFLERRALAALLPPDAVHQGLAVAVDPLPSRDLGTILASLPDDATPRLVVVLDQVSDPHNIGAVLRSAAVFGAAAVIVPEHGAAPATGFVAKAASGALETVPLIEAGNLARALERLKAANFWCIGLAADAAGRLDALARPKRIALVLGAEGKGLRRLTRERCDFLVHIATPGAFTSLNVSNAAAIALYELARPAAASV